MLSTMFAVDSAVWDSIATTVIVPVLVALGALVNKWINRLIERFEGATTAQTDQIVARLDAMDARFTGVEDRLSSVETKANGIAATTDAIEREIVNP